MDDPSVLGAEAAEHFGQRHDPLPGKHADELEFGACRIGKRPHQIENGPGAKLHPRRPDMAHRAVMARRQHEADVGLPQRLFHEAHIGLDIDAEGRQDIGCAGLGGCGPVAVLGDRHAGGSRDNCRACRDIQGAGAIAPGAAGVQRPRRGLDAMHLGPHGAHRAHDLRHGLAAHAQRHQESADLGRGRIARHQDVESLLGLGLVEGAPAGGNSDQGLQIVHATAFTLWRWRVTGFTLWPARRRKLLKRRWPCSEAMLSG